MKAAYELLQVGCESGHYNFVGNVESSHLFDKDSAKVIVCDGFVGNTILKLSEGFFSIHAKSGEVDSFWNTLNYENTGGTPVLGINAPVIIGHGKSTAKAIKNMVLTTERTIRNNMVAKLQAAFE